MKEKHMRKLLVALALAATLSPGASQAASHAGTMFQNHVVQWNRGGSLRDTTSIFATGDTVRTGLITLKNADWSQAFPMVSSSAVARHFIKVSVVMGQTNSPFTGSESDTIPDTLYCWQEPTFDGGTTYSLNNIKAIANLHYLVRDEDVPPCALPQTWTGYIDLDLDTNPTFAIANWVSLYTPEFRLRIKPGDTTPINCNNTTGGNGVVMNNCRIYVSYPEARYVSGGGATELGTTINKKPLFFMDPSLADTTFMQDENDTTYTANINISDLDWDISSSNSTAAGKYCAAKVVFECYGTATAADTIYGSIELSNDKGATYTPTFMIGAGTNAKLNWVPCVKVSNGSAATSATGPMCFVGYIYAYPTGTNGVPNNGFLGTTDFRLRLSGDIGGTSPVLSNTKGWIYYPARRIAY